MNNLCACLASPAIRYPCSHSAATFTYTCSGVDDGVQQSARTRLRHVVRHSQSWGITLFVVIVIFVLQLFFLLLLLLLCRLGSWWVSEAVSHHLRILLRLWRKVNPDCHETAIHSGSTEASLVWSPLLPGPLLSPGWQLMTREITTTIGMIT